MGLECIFYKKIPAYTFYEKQMHIQLFFLKNLNILRLPDKIALENFLFISKYSSQTLPKSFNNWFILAAPSHRNNTKWLPDNTFT